MKKLETLVSLICSMPSLSSKELPHKSSERYVHFTPSHRISPLTKPLCLLPIVFAKLRTLQLRGLYARRTAGEHHSSRARPQTHDPVRHGEGRAPQKIVSKQTQHCFDTHLTLSSCLIAVLRRANCPRSNVRTPSLATSASARGRS